MIKYYCDKCDKEVERYIMFTVTITPPEIRQYGDDDIFDYSGSGILCRDCIKEFEKWLRRRHE